MKQSGLHACEFQLLISSVFHTCETLERTLASGLNNNDNKWRWWVQTIAACPGEFQVVFCSNLLGCVKLLSKKVRFSYLLRQHVNCWSYCCRRRENRVAEGAEWGGKRGQPTKGQGRRELSQRGLGRSPGRKRFLCFLGRQNGSLCNICRKFCIFLANFEAEPSAPCLMLSYLTSYLNCLNKFYLFNSCFNV